MTTDTHRPVWIALFGALAASVACADVNRAWVPVARDANYTIYIDTAHLIAREHNVVEVWFRTDHATPRLHREKPFNREVVLSLVSCRWGNFKVAQVDMYNGERRLVARQRTEGLDLQRQEWRRISDDSAEQMAAEAACHFAGRTLTRAHGPPPPGYVATPTRPSERR